MVINITNSAPTQSTYTQNQQGDAVGQSRVVDVAVVVCRSRINFVVDVKMRNVLFKDALNTFYLRLYGVRHMVKDHSDSEKGNPLPPHWLLLSINSKGSFISTIPQKG